MRTSRMIGPGNGGEHEEKRVIYGIGNALKRMRRARCKDVDADKQKVNEALDIEVRKLRERADMLEALIGGGEGSDCVEWAQEIERVLKLRYVAFLGEWR